MNEFNFRVANAAPRASGFEIGQNVGDTKTTYIYSYKTKYINGKSTGQKTNVDWDMGSSIPSWVSVKYVFEGNDCKVTFTTLQENTGSSARTHTLVFNQRESGNKINLTVTQGSGVTYTGYIKMVTNSLPLGGSKGNTAQIIVMAYLNGSDGSKKPETPHVGSAPDWCSVSVASVGTQENHYMLSLTALSSNQTGANRSGHIFLTCGDANLSIPVTQVTQQASTFTLSGLPTDTSYYLFGKGAFPQNTPSSGQMYLQGLSATGTTTIKIPFYANASEPGSRIECTTGDKVAVYTKSGATWISEGSFIVPSAGGTVSI